MNRPSVIVTGFLHDALGIGESARGYAEALAAAGCDVSVHPIDVPGRAPTTVPGPAHDGVPLQVVGADAEADVVVVAINPPELARFRFEGVPLPTGRARIAIWTWEVDPVPASWAGEATAFDEVWTNSDYMGGLLRAVLPVPVFAQPPPLRLGGASSVPAVQPPVVITVADGWSSLTRKNTLGAVETFCRAVAPGSGPRLIVKLRNGDADPDGLDAVIAAAAGRDDIDVIDRFLPRSELLDLIGSATCVLSLHRAEGFGLVLFEALAMGVPVICTGGTGPAQLLGSTPAVVVTGHPAIVDDTALHYGAGGRWVEPDIDEAARLLRALLDDPASARASARAASAGLRALLEPAAVGAPLEARVRDVVDLSHGPAVSVVLHATKAWPSIEPVIAAARTAKVDVEVIVGATSEGVIPHNERGADVRLAVVASHSPFDLRQAALRLARGRLIIITEDHCVPAPGWIDALAAAQATTRAPVLAGPVRNGARASRADWANYLIGFAAWAPPLVAPPDGWAPTIANVGISRSLLDAATLDAPPGTIERTVVPRWWLWCPTIVPDAAVEHVQSHHLLAHAVNHFTDCRTAGAHERSAGAPPRSLRPDLLRREARHWLAEASKGVAHHPDLHSHHRRAAWPLRTLAMMRALGLAIGSRWGAGRSAQRLD